MSLPHIRTETQSRTSYRSTLLDIVEAVVRSGPRKIDGDISSQNFVVYRCKHNAGLFNCLLMFLQFAERAEAKGCDAVFFDGMCLPLYGNISAVFPAVPEATNGAGGTEQTSKECCGGGSFANMRGVYERRGPLTAEDG